jgi:hypothetical protein
MIGSIRKLKTAKGGQMRTLPVTIGLCVATILLGGCTHELTIENSSDYSTFGAPSLDKALRIGIATDASQPDQRKLLDGVASALGSYSARVVMPYATTSEKEVDAIVNIDVQTEHNGSGWNFLINWPGFLIFAPAWHGYIYEVKYTINVAIKKAGSKDLIDQFKLPLALDVRHASYNRTWTEVSWLEVSVIAFVGGLVFIGYDDSVTPLVSDKVETPLGKYIAQEIVKRINASGKFAYIYQKGDMSRLAALKPAFPQ